MKHSGARVAAVVAALTLVGGCSRQPIVIGRQILRTPAGSEYGVIAGAPGKPLVLIFTSDIASSLDGTFTSIGKSLSRANYTIATIDLTCHGNDLQAGEPAGLECWARRIQRGGADIFEPMVRRASDVITEVARKGIASDKGVMYPYEIGRLAFGSEWATLMRWRDEHERSG